ncbi:MAG: DUF547 domain-containing protein [Bacteroidota bacterium]
MKQRCSYSSVTFVLLIILCATPNSHGQDYIKLSKDFFMAVRNKNTDASFFAAHLAKANPDKLKLQLITEDKAKAFWINLYNSYVQFALTKNPKLFEDRGTFFKTAGIEVAGQMLSPDDIEHGIIRHSKNKLSMGYLDKFSISEYEKNFRLEKIDYRVHFALNCGAKSCPPIVFYESEKLEEQLNTSTRLYLKKFASHDAKSNVAMAPVLCSWFKADFGGEEGVIDILIKNKIVPTGNSPDLKYLDYDWTLSLGNYTREN